MRPDGSVIEQPGYDAATGFVYAPELTFKRVPDHPSQADACEALQALCEVWCDVPFSTEAQRYVPIAALLTILGRPAIQGSCPAFVVDASTRGSGKTLVLDAVSVIATGRPTSKMSWPPDDVELEKVLGAYALRSAAIVAFDNCTSRFGGGPLDRVLTAGDRVELRILGKSEIPSLRWRAVVLASGNNIDLAGDTARRCLWTRLEPGTEHPELRTGFRHPNLLEWCAKERTRLVGCALTILRAFVAAARPAQDCAPWGSFEAWARLVPAAIKFAGGEDVLGARPIAMGHEEPEAVALTAILQHLPTLVRSLFSGEHDGMTARAIIETLYPQERLRGDARPDGHDPLRDAIEAIVTTAPGKAPSVSKFAGKLRSMRRRVKGGLMLDQTPDRNGTACWRVVRCGV